MMSEKRFTINLEDECIDDAEERIFISFLDRIDFYELCGFLNEQDEKIKELTTKRDQLVQKKNRYFRLYNSVEAEVKVVKNGNNTKKHKSNNLKKRMRIYEKLTRKTNYYTKKM